MQLELREIHQKLRLTTLFVTHDQEEALSLSDRVVLINQGRIEQEGAPQQIYSAPRSDFAANFLGAANILEVEVKFAPLGWVALLGCGQTLPLPTNVGREGHTKIALRQEDLRLVSQAPLNAPTLQGVVERRIYLGSASRYLVKIGAQSIRVLDHSDTVFEPGNTVFITIAPTAILII